MYRFGEGPKSCLTCSKAIAPDEWRVKQLLLKPSGNASCFCDRSCAGKWKQCEAGRRHKCAKCGKRTGWNKSGTLCIDCVKPADLTCNCKHCGKEFAKRPHDPKQYCSVQCWGEWKKEQRRTNCKKCGMSFIAKNPRFATYCSRLCSGTGEIGKGRPRLSKQDRQRNADLKRLNARARRDEQVWNAEQPKRCKCGRPVSHGRRCGSCRRAKRYDIKKRQNRRYKEFYKSGIRKVIIARDRGVCQYCGRRPRRPTVDHVVPLSLGGTNDETNLVVACKRCNCIKCDRMPLNLFNAANWIQWKSERALNKRQGTLFN